MYACPPLAGTPSRLSITTVRYTWISADCNRQKKYQQWHPEMLGEWHNPDFLLRVNTWMLPWSLAFKTSPFSWDFAKDELFNWTMDKTIKRVTKTKTCTTYEAKTTTTRRQNHHSLPEPPAATRTTNSRQNHHPPAARTTTRCQNHHSLPEPPPAAKTTTRGQTTTTCCQNHHSLPELPPAARLPPPAARTTQSKYWV